MPSVTLLEVSWLETGCLPNKTVSDATQIFSTRAVSPDFSMFFPLFGPTVRVHSNFSDPIRPVALSSDLARHVAPSNTNFRRWWADPPNAALTQTAPMPTSDNGIRTAGNRAARITFAPTLARQTRRSFLFGAQETFLILMEPIKNFCVGSRYGKFYP